MKVSGSEQNPEGTEGPGERGRGKGPGGYNCMTMYFLHRLSGTDSLNPLIMYKKRGRKGLKWVSHAEGEGQRAWVCFIWWCKCKEPGVRSKAETAVQSAGDPVLPDICLQNVCSLLCRLPSAFPWRGCLVVPSKQHLSPLGTGTDSPEGNPWASIPLEQKCSSC